MKLYAFVKDTTKCLIISNDIEKDAKQAKMTINEFVIETKKLNPQLNNFHIRFND